MNKYLIALIVCLLCFETQAQRDTTRIKSSIELNASFSGIENGFVINPSFSIQKNKNLIGIGPTLFYYNGDIAAETKKITLSGLQGVYQFNPNPTKKIIQFWFQANVIYQRFAYKGTTSFFNSQTNQFEDFSFETIDNSIEIYAGYGLEVNICKGLYLHQSLGLGINTLMRNQNSGFVSETTNKTDFSRIIKFGIGYSL